MWTATSNPIAPGNSLAGFQFDSDVAPAVLDGDSPFYTSTPILTATAYSGAGFSDAGDRIAVADGGAMAAPEPSSTALPIAEALLVAFWRLRRPRCLSRTA